jgi:hypothetical protein
MIEGSGSVPLTNISGSGSKRPKNIRLRRIRIRICNTDFYCTVLPLGLLLCRGNQAFF